MNKIYLTELLHTMDPMHTGCAQNLDMEDEYSAEAAEIVHRVYSGQDPEEAAIEVFAEWFHPMILSDVRKYLIKEVIRKAI